MHHMKKWTLEWRRKLQNNFIFPVFFATLVHQGRHILVHFSQDAHNFQATVSKTLLIRPAIGLKKMGLICRAVLLSS